MYVRKTYTIGDIKLVEKHYPAGAPGRQRGQKTAATPEAMKKVNQRNRAKHVQRLILANFKGGDYHVTLTYTPEERPSSMEEAKKDRKRFLTQLRREYRKLGTELKYLGGTEQGVRGAYHHHLVINVISAGGVTTSDLIDRCWAKGHENLSPLYRNDDYRQLAEYLVKKETKEEGGWSYTRSRNLEDPKPRVEKIHARAWAREPKAPRGYYVDKSTLHNGENPFTGLPWQEYTLRRVKKE